MSGQLTGGFEAIPEEISFLAGITGLDCNAFKHEMVGATFPETDSTDAHSLIEYTVPQRSCWIISRIGLSTIPPVNDASLTEGDWRSEYFDAIGTAKMWLTVNDSPKTPTNAVWFILTNRPVLFLFNGGEKVNLMVQRLADDVPPSMRVLLAIHSYIRPSKAYDLLSRAETLIVATYVPTPEP